MRKRQISTLRAVRCAVLLALLVPLIAAGYHQTVSAVTSGTSYTSPHFGYSITWQSPWYVTEDETDANGFDVLGLSDGQSMVYFSGADSNASSPNQVIEEYASQFSSSPDWNNFHQLDPSACAVTAESGTAAACYAGNQTFSDGTQSAVSLMLKAWDLGNGLDLLFEGYAETSTFASYLPQWQAFGVYPPGAVVPTATAGSCQSFVEQGIEFCFDPNLSKRDRDDITEAVRLGQDAIARYFGDPNLSGVRVNGFASVSADGPESLATTLNRSIAVYAGSNVWQSISPVERIQTVVHEFFHVYQNIMTEQSSAIIPLWFTEGTAEAVGYLAAAQLGVSDQNDFYELAAYSLTEFPVASSLDALQPSGSMTADAYPLAYMAIQYLLGNQGLSVSAIGEVYQKLAAGSSFEQAFKAVFAETLDAFTANFETWIPTLAKVNDLPAAFWPTDETVGPAAVSLMSAPAQAAPDDQIVVVGKTASLAKCNATLQSGAQQLERQTFANGNGAVFWLMTIPSDMPSGAATLTLSCGSTPVTTSISIA